MSNISSFPTAIPDGDDLILGSQTDVAGTPSTKNFTVQSIVDLAPGGSGSSYLPLAGGTLSGNLRIAKTFPSLELQDLSTGSSNSRSIRFLNSIGTEGGSIRYQSGPDGGGDPGITIKTEGLGRTSFRIGQSMFEWKMYESSTSAVETAMIVAVKNSSASRLTLYDGDIEIDEAGDGIILKSPNGTKYKVTVANGGSLVVTAV